MRKSKLTPEEILKAEKAGDERKQSRNRGFLKMKERDMGYRWLKELNGHKEVLMRWDSEWGNKFMLSIDGEHYVFDAEEFRKALRWV